MTPRDRPRGARGGIGLAAAALGAMLAGCTDFDVELESYVRGLGANESAKAERAGDPPSRPDAPRVTVAGDTMIVTSPDGSVARVTREGVDDGRTRVRRIGDATVITREGPSGSVRIVQRTP